MLYACPYPVSHQDIPEFASGVPGYGLEINFTDCCHLRTYHGHIKALSPHRRFAAVPI